MADADCVWREDPERVAVLVGNLLTDAGVSLEELNRQASESRFGSDKLRRTWFTVTALLQDGVRVSSDSDRMYFANLDDFFEPGGPADG